MHVQNTVSSRGLTTIGVPQGSILGPLLFFIYNNDLSNSVNICAINMYADDTELHYCHSHLQKVEQVLQRQLEQVYNWMTVNRFALSIASMLIGSRQSNGSILKLISSTKYLGLNQQLTWQDHIDYIMKRELP